MSYHSANVMLLSVNKLTGVFLLCNGHLYSLLVYFTLLVGQQEGHPACRKQSGGCWCGYLSGAQCRLAYGPADATVTHCPLLQ